LRDRKVRQSSISSSQAWAPGRVRFQDQNLVERLLGLRECSMPIGPISNILRIGTRQKWTRLEKKVNSQYKNEKQKPKIRKKI